MRRALVVLLVLVGCGKARPVQQVSAPVGSAVAAVPAGTASAEAAKLKVKDAAGTELYTIKLMADGAKLVDASGRELARLKAHEDRVKIVGPGEAVLGNISGGVDKLSVKADDKTVLFVLRRKPDGDYVLKDRSDVALFKIKPKAADYVRVEDDAGNTLWKARRRDGKAVLYDGKDAVVLKADGSPSLIGFALLGIDRLTPPQKAALYYRLDALGVP